MDSTQGTPSKTTNRLLIALLVAFSIAAVLTGYLTYVAVRDFVLSYSMTKLPGISISQSQPNAALGTPAIPGTPSAIQNAQTPLQPVGGPTPEPWDGASRVTVLMMGLDYRDWLANMGAPRTDTMILFTIDPLNRTAGMLSIPRDLWVTIPGGFKSGRINTAYALGEQYKVPGGGPALAMATVEDLLGVPVDYYALIDFGSFVKFIDEMQGVKINVKDPIRVDPVIGPSKNLKPGVQTLSGELALGYARVRKTEGGDFDRAQRQQQVILAIRDRVLALGLPSLISKAPALYQEIAAGVKTNLNLEQVIQLAWLAQQIPAESIKRGAIAPPDQVLLVKSPQGDDVLKPIRDKIRATRDEVFFGTAQISPASIGMSPLDLVKAEAPKLQILNGTGTAGLASKTAEYLQSQGIPVASSGNADKQYTNTTLIDYTGKAYTLKYLADLMKVGTNQIFSRYDPTSQVDVVVILGQDWAVKNPMP